MNYIEMLNEIFQVCIIPLFGILTTYLVKYITIKMEEIQLKAKNEKANKYLDMLTDTITSCVIATNQTYVEALKKEGKFDLEAQKLAFEKTMNAVLALLTKESQEYLNEAVGDLNLYISQQIEAAVNLTK